MNNTQPIAPRSTIALILGVSAFLFLFLVWLIYFQKPLDITGTDASFLPTLNALLNSLSTIFIVIGVVAVKQKKVTLHKVSMATALLSSSGFLASYVIYHATHGDSLFQGEGIIRIVYFTILISHIVLCAVVLPLILTSVYFAITGRLVSHRRVAKWTFPLWLYISVTGVVIYFFLRI